jgi:hypothetical protein
MSTRHFVLLVETHVVEHPQGYEPKRAREMPHRVPREYAKIDLPVE